MSRKAWWVLIITLAMTAITINLGLWQLRRADQKQQISERLHRQAQLPPLSTSQLLAQDLVLANTLQRQASVSGRWLPDHNVFLDNRQMSQRVGFYVVTPLQLSAPGQPILIVQRGWIPVNQQNRQQLATIHTTDTEVTITGILSAQVSQSFALGQDAGGPIRQNLELAKYTKEIGKSVLPFVLIQTSEDAPGPGMTLQRNWPAITAGIEKHLGYAFQWFLLSGLLVALYTWFQWLLPYRKKRRARQFPLDSNPAP